MNETITINIDLHEIRDLSRAIDDLRNVIQDLNRDLSSSGSAWGILDSSLNLMIGTMGLLALRGSDLQNIPANIKKITGALVSSTGLSGAFIATSVQAGGLSALLGLGKGLGGALLALKAPIGFAVLALGGLLYAFRDTEESTLNTGAHIDHLGERFIYLQERYEHLDERIEGHGDRVARAHQMYEDGIINADDLALSLTLLGITHGDLSDQQEEVERTMRSLGAYMQIHGISYDMLTETQQAFVDRGVGYWQMYADMGSEMFREIGQANQLSLEEALANQDANYEATKAWHENLQVLYQRYGAEVYQHFFDMGEDGMHLTGEMADNVRENYRLMADGTYECLGQMEDGSYAFATQLVNNMERGGDLASTIMVDKLGEGSELVVAAMADLAQEAPETLRQGFEAANFPQMGERICEGIVEGIRNGELRAFVQLALLAEELGICFETALGINSPSRVFMEYGGNIIDGLCKGLEDNQDQVTSTLETLNTAMERVYNRSDRTFQNIGRDIINGLNQGLLNRENTVMSTVRRIANNITREMQSALQINSPSRVMREGIGRFIPEGVAAGIDKYAGAAIDSVHKLGNDLINVNIPSVESMIGMGPSMRYAGAGGSSSSYDNRVVNNNSGLFDGATINWHGEEDIRRTMEKIAWATERESARMW